MLSKAVLFIQSLSHLLTVDVPYRYVFFVELVHLLQLL